MVTTSAAGPAHRAPKLSFGKRSLFAALVLVLVLALAEGTARLLDLQPRPPKTSPVLFAGAAFDGSFPIVYDAEIFWRLEKGGLIPAQLESVNAEGFRGPGVRGQKSEGTRRVLFLGDSNTFGFGVQNSATFAWRVGRWLKTSPNATFECLNAGVPGYSVFQMRRWFEIEGKALAPDLVVIYAGAWNDFSIAIDADDVALAETLTRRRRGVFGSRLVSWLVSQKSPSQGDLRLMEERRQEAIRAFGEGRPLPHGPRLKPDRFRSELMGLMKQIKGAGAQAILVVPPAPPATRSRFQGSDAYAGIVRDVGRHSTAILVDARQRFMDVGKESEERLFLDNIHPSELGHALLAYEIAAAIAKTPLAGVPAFFEDPASLHSQSLVEGLFRATITTHKGEVHAGLALAKDAHHGVLLLRAPHEIRFHALKIPRVAALVLELAAAPPAGESEHDPSLRFEVRAATPDSKETQLLEAEVRASTDAAPTPLPVTVDLAEFAGQSIDLVLRTHGRNLLAYWGPAKIDPYR